jgi:hypothetical protein
LGISSNKPSGKESNPIVRLSLDDRTCSFFASFAGCMIINL